MKTYFFLLYVLLSVSAFTQSTLSGVVHYESNYSQKNINNYFSKKRNLIKNKVDVKVTDNLLLNSKKVASTLQFSLNEAIFEVNKKLSIRDRGDMVEKMSLLSAGGSKSFYTTTITKTLEKQDCETLGACFIIVSKFKEWKLTQETKKIAGYTCYKATSTMKSNARNIHVVAWYAPEIPVSFGPHMYNGLPGLILEVENNFMYFKAIKLVLNPKEKVLIKKPTKGKKVSQEEFNKISKEAFSKL